MLLFWIFVSGITFFALINWRMIEKTTLTDVPAAHESLYTVLVQLPLGGANP